jgi:hypothetical protein
MAYDFVPASSQYISANIGSYDEPLTIHARVNINNVPTVSLSAIALNTNGAQLRHQLNVQQPDASVAVGSVNAAGTSAAAVATAVPTATWNSIAGVLASDTSRTAYRQGVAGTPNTTSREITFDLMTIGARIATTVGLYFDGKLADIAMWTAVLTDDEINSLRRGFKPHRIRPQSLLFYVPLLRNLQDIKGLLSLTNNNSATVADHPGVY